MWSSKEMEMDPGSSSAWQMDPGSSSAMEMDPETAIFESLIHFGFCPRLNFMSVSHVIQTRYRNGLPEEFIAIIMRDVLRALAYLLVHKSYDHPDLNSSQVFICPNTDFVAIKILADPRLKYGYGKPIQSRKFTSTQGILGLGIIALEMAYGSRIATCNLKCPWFLIVNNVVTALKQILDNPDEEGEETAKKELESAENLTVKEVAMQRGTGTLKIAYGLELKEKAMQKGKEPLKISDDPKGKGKAIEKGKEKWKLEDDPIGKTMAQQKGKAIAKGNEKMGLEDDPTGKTMAQQKEKAIEKGKEKLGLEDNPAGKTMAEQKRKEMAKRKGNEQKKLIIKLPPLKNLINPFYFEELVYKSNRGKDDQEKKKTNLINPFYVEEPVDKSKSGQEDQEKKNGNAELKEILKKVLMFICCLRVKAAKTKFSRDFLEVVLMCLDESRQPTAKEILEHPFFHQPLNVRKFERTMRSIQPQSWGESETIP